MIVCSCNVISRAEIEDAVTELLREDPWRVIVPIQVYHAIERRGKCCSCFPNVIEIILETTQAFHRRMETPEAELISLVDAQREANAARESFRRVRQRRFAAGHAA